MRTHVSDPRLKITSGGGNQKGEEKLIKEAGDLRAEYQKGGIPEYETALTRVEKLLKETKVGKLKGVGVLASGLPDIAVSKEAVDNRAEIDPLMRIEALQAGGKALTPTEIKEINKITSKMLGRGETHFRQSMKQLREKFDAIKKNQLAGVHPDVVDYFRATGGVTGGSENAPMSSFIRE
jgi:hypothetical protein